MNRPATYAILAICYIALVASPAMAQTSFTPENLGRQVNSPYPEINPVISRDGKTLFFTRVDHPDNRYGEDNSQDIWYTLLQPDGTWGQARRLPNTVNIGRFNSILAALDDGKSYLIMGRFNQRGTRWLTRGLSIVEQVDERTWTAPRPLEVRGLRRINRGRVSTAFLTPDREILLLSISTSASGRRSRLYVSHRVGADAYSEPLRMRGIINDAVSIEAPFLTADRNRLYFAADYDEGPAAQNIYFAQRQDDTFREWSIPVKANDTINTSNWESFFKLNPKESWAFFSSNTRSHGRADIFRVKMFEENPFVYLSGRILNQTDRSPMLQDTTYRILVNGEPFGELRIDRRTATYTAVLPLGRAFTLTPEMANWNGISASIDLTHVREHSSQEMNLYFSAIPFVQVKGQIVNTRTNQPIELSRNPQVLLNGKPSDSVRFERFSSAFQALLPLGQKYTFTPVVPHFTGKAEVVDVSKATSFTSREITLYVTSVPWVEVRGMALDNSSFTPILGAAQPKLLINGQVTDTVVIDPATGAFTLRLPFGAAYTLGIQAKDYRTINNPLDLRSFVEFAQIDQNVFAERSDVNMVTLTGTIINTKTGRQLEPGIIAGMKVNGVLSQAFVYNTQDATYSLRLPVGFNYDLTPHVINFYNKFEPVDLTRATPMTRVVRNFYVTPIEVGQSVDIEHIYFETGRAELKPESFRSLKALMEFLKEYPNVRVEIGGHTDNVGSAAVNERLSQARAQAVADYLIGLGTHPDRIVARGYGFSRPKASNRTAEGRAQNRRVDFTITGI